MHIMLNLSIILAVMSLKCTGEKDPVFSGFQPAQQKGFHPGYQEYCALDRTANFEELAVQASFYGDYDRAIHFATLAAPYPDGPALRFEGVGEAPEALAAAQEQLKKLLQEGELHQLLPATGEPPEAMAGKLLALLQGPASPEEAFAGHRMASALDYIVERAGHYHFTLINEAHYNGQHRAFTRALLRPLWEKGYRYLALETLSHHDPALAARGYPVRGSGPYLPEVAFGNLVREALALGYTLVPYEIQDEDAEAVQSRQAYNALRDSIQAHNIFKRTLQQDAQGKVLVHAGYGHIFKSGDREYLPMGLQLRRLARQDVLSIDQETMTEKRDERKQSAYYRYVQTALASSAPTVFLDSSSQALVVGLQALGVDIQVYHPPTVFHQGRPEWLMGPQARWCELPTVLLEKEGFLLQAVYPGEPAEVVPVDQLIITPESRALILPPGRFELRLIDCQGALRGTMEVSIP